jgi:hypothetical protein
MPGSFGDGFSQRKLTPRTASLLHAHCAFHISLSPTPGGRQHTRR